MKKCSLEVIRTLEGEVNFLMERVTELDNNLMEYISCKKEQGESQLLTIAMAYALSGIYSCFEDQFSKIARVFENRVENLASWHKELLKRMRIEVPDIRPTVISRESFAILDEMRGFRHVFRSSYMFTLDVERLNLVVNRWQKGKDRVITDVKHFLEILEQ
ncbi:hypothetical protein KKE26_09615 [bacterium]|nr:hypothetical protein [bacterium]MBU1753205.1 hypothetical protein [bacterium]